MAPYLNFIYPSYKQYFVHRKKCSVTYLGSQKLMFTWFICEFNSSLPYSKWFPINILPIILLHVWLLSFFNLSLCLILLFVSEYVQSNISTTLSRRHISYVNYSKISLRHNIAMTILNLGVYCYRTDNELIRKNNSVWTSKVYNCCNLMKGAIIFI